MPAKISATLAFGGSLLLLTTIPLPVLSDPAATTSVPGVSVTSDQQVTKPASSSLVPSVGSGGTGVTAGGVPAAGRILGSGSQLGGHNASGGVKVPGGGVKPNLPGNISDQLNNGPGSQQILDVGRGALGNTGIGQLNAEINQAGDLRQQGVQDRVNNDGANLDGFNTIVDFAQHLQETDQAQRDAANALDGNPVQTGPSGEERQAAEQRFLQDLSKSQGEAQAAAQDEAAGALDGGAEGSAGSGGTSNGGTSSGSSGTPTEPTATGQASGGSIFQDPTKGTGGIGVQQGVDAGGGLLDSNIGGSLENRIQGSQLNGLNGAPVGVRSLKMEGGAGRGSNIEQDNLAAPKLSPFASGNFRQGFSTSTGAGKTGALPVNVNTSHTGNVIPGGRLSPNLIPGGLPGAGRIALPGIAGGAALPVNPGRLPGAGLPANIGGVLPGARVGVPAGLNINRVPAFSGVKLPANVPSIAPANAGGAFRPVVPSVSEPPAAGRLPVARPQIPTGGIQRSGAR